MHCLNCGVGSELCLGVSRGSRAWTRGPAPLLVEGALHPHRLLSLRSQHLPRWSHSTWHPLACWHPHPVRVVTGSTWFPFAGLWCPLPRQAHQQDGYSAGNDEHPNHRTPPGVSGVSVTSGVRDQLLRYSSPSLLALLAPSSPPAGPPPWSAGRACVV